MTMPKVFETADLEARQINNQYITKQESLEINPEALLFLLYEHFQVLFLLLCGHSQGFVLNASAAFAYSSSLSIFSSMGFPSSVRENT